MKKLLGILSIFLLVLLLSNASFAYSKFDASVYINDNKVYSDMDYIIKNGRMYVPVDIFRDNLNATYKYYSHSKRLIIKYESDVICVFTDTGKIIVNNTHYQLDIPSIIIDGNVMVPVRFICEVLNLDISWESSTRSVRIQTKDYIEEVKDESTAASVKSDEVVKQYQGTVVIDAGHGGFQTGASYNGIHEKDINLEVSLKVIDLLEPYGINVLHTRVTDKYVSLNKRTTIANDKKADLFVSIHSNAAPNENYRGIMSLYYPTSKTKANGLNGYRLSEIMQNNMIDATNNVDLGLIPRKYLYVLHHTKMPATIVEIGFMTNDDDMALLKTDAYKNKIAESICKGILEALAY